LRDGGSLSNASTGTIVGGDGNGVYTWAGPGTVTNAGTITGTGAAAVFFSAGFANRLMVDPGAVFNGTVTGGNTIGAASASELELVSGASAGTLSGIGTQFVDFAQTTIDGSAAWTWTGTNTLAGGTTLDVAGTLTLSNAVVNDGGIVTGNGTIIVDPSTLTVGALTGTGDLVIESASTVTILGTVGAGETIDFAGGNGDLTLSAAAFSGTIEGLNFSDTIDLSGVTGGASTGLVNGNTLQIQEATGPVMSLVLDPKQDYTGVSFTVGADGAVTNDLGRTLSWIGGGGNTALGTAANWDDLTNALDPAQTAPDATDTSSSTPTKVLSPGQARSPRRRSARMAMACWSSAVARPSSAARSTPALSRRMLDRSA
jgi:hypothetical protein